MPVAPTEAWEEPDPDLPPPEPAPPDWAPPTPLEARIDVAPSGPSPPEDQPPPPPGKARRLLVTTAVFAALWLAGIPLLRTSGSPTLLLIVLLPVYLVTLLFVLRTPKQRRRPKGRLLERLGWQGRLMTGVAVFLAVYIPFTFVSNAVIPFAPLVEYVLFALLLLVLLRLAGRSSGVAPSLEALPPPHHRLHQQVVSPIDDAHYQNTLWLNYSFVEKGRGGRHLARRLDQILESNGVAPARRTQLLEPLAGYREPARLAFTRRGRERRTAGRERRSQMLEALFVRLNQELEQPA